MAKQSVNLGTSANKGDGDPLRTAFDKVNDNFTEVYSLLGAEGGDVDDVVAPMLVHNSHTNVTVTRDDAANKIIFSVDPYDGDITGSVFGDDSTVLVDGVNNTIPKANIEDSANWDTAFGWGNHTAGGYAPQTTTYTKTEVDSAISAVNTLDGDFTGSVFGDDSTVLVDGVNNKIVGTVDTASLTVSSTDVAIGRNAGLNQGIDSIAIGYDAGKTTQGSGAIAIGPEAGEVTQGNLAVAIGYHAGEESQGASAVAIGDSAGGYGAQGANAIAVGKDAGWDTQGIGAVAIGQQAGETTQGADAVAIGKQAGYATQSANATAVGVNAGKNQQFANAVAIGSSAGKLGQGTAAIAIGSLAGETAQGANAIAIGEKAGYANQAANSIVINATGTEVYNFGASSLVITPVRDAVGTTMMMYDATTGEVTHTASPVITGDITGSVFGDDSTVLVDGVNNKIVGNVETSSLRTSESKIALGNAAGETQGNNAVAIGDEAGKTSQGSGAVALGNAAGKTSQGLVSVAIGEWAGRTTQGEHAVALGNFAGSINQGARAIAIGDQAGVNNQAANSIIISALGMELDNNTASSLVIKPIRSAAMTTILGYDAGTGEVTHNAAIPGYTNTADLKVLVAASTDFANFQTRIAAL